MNLSKYINQSSRRGFTLIELMVVVVIIGILSAFVVPAILSFREKSAVKEQIDQASEQLRTAAARRAEEKQAGLPAVVPVTDSADIRVDLDTHHYIHRLKVYTLFDAAFEGTFVFRNNSDGADRIRVFFPFPQGTTQAGNVSLSILGPNGKFAEPEDVAYTLRGIKWYAALPKGNTLTAKVTYGAQGRDKFIYTGPGAGRAGEFKLRLGLKGAKAEMIPADALRPSDTDKDTIFWNYTNLVTDRRVILELPGAMSPVGRIILLLKLAGLAVFLFGLGFLYLNELCLPGRLDNFRWGDFLLLALNYFLFFIIFMILSRTGDLHAIPAMGLSAVLSIPLLMIHVSRVLDRQFALKYTLPLTIITLAFVINGVYGGAVKSYVFIGITVLVIGFLTFTLREWGDKRKAHKEQREQAEKEKREAEIEEQQAQKRLHKEAERQKAFEKKLKNQWMPLKQRWTDAAARINEARILLDEEDAPASEQAREKVNSQVETLESCRHLVRDMEDRVSEILDLENPEDQKTSAETFDQELALSRLRLNKHIQKLSTAMDGLKQSRHQAETRTVQKTELPHCIACGKPSPSSVYCPACGTERPRGMHCEGCGSSYPLAVHLIKTRKPLIELHCMVCGKKYEPLGRELG